MTSFTWPKPRISSGGEANAAAVSSLSALRDGASSSAVARYSAIHCRSARRSVVLPNTSTAVPRKPFRRASRQTPSWSPPGGELRYPESRRHSFPRPVARLLQQWQPHQRLGAAHADAAFFERVVLVVQAGRGQGFAQVGDSEAFTMSVSACFFCPDECRKRSRYRKITNSNT